MESRPSIRKQFLTKIYQRKSNENLPETENSYDPNSSFVSQNSDFHQQSTQNIISPERINKRSSTPSGPQLRRTPTPQKPSNMRIFTDFLTELQNSSQITSSSLGKVQEVTKALNDNFAKNPEFSLQFYISMTGIINLLNEPNDINFSDFRSNRRSLEFNKRRNSRDRTINDIKKIHIKSKLKSHNSNLQIDFKKTFIQP